MRVTPRSLCKTPEAVLPDLYCTGCDKQVLDVRDLTLPEARTLFDRERARGHDVCVKGYADDDGFLAFVDERAPRAARPLARLALAASMTACSPRETATGAERQPAVAEASSVRAPPVVAASQTPAPPASTGGATATVVDAGASPGAPSPATLAAGDAGVARADGAPCDHTEAEHAAMNARDEPRARRRRRTVNGSVGSRHVGPIMGGLAR